MRIDHALKRKGRGMSRYPLAWEMGAVKHMARALAAVVAGYFLYAEGPHAPHAALHRAISDQRAPLV